MCVDPIEEHYKESLVIKKDSVKCSRRSIFSKKKINEWFYSSSKTLEGLFDKACELISKIDFHTKSEVISKVGYFDIIVEYDDKKDKRRFYYSFEFNNLNKLAEIIRCMIPKHEIISEVYFKSIPFEKDEFRGEIKYTQCGSVLVKSVGRKSDYCIYPDNHDKWIYVSDKHGEKAFPEIHSLTKEQALRFAQLMGMSKEEFDK